MFLNVKFIESFDTAEDVAVTLPVLNTEINVMCNPPLPIPLHVKKNLQVAHSITSSLLKYFNRYKKNKVLPELSIEQTETAVRNVISNMSTCILNGLYIEHLWFTEQKQNILYHGHIISVKSTGKVPKATICY